MMTGLQLLASLVASLVAETLLLGTIVLEDLILLDQHVQDSVQMELSTQQVAIPVMMGTVLTETVVLLNAKLKLDFHVLATLHLFQSVLRSVEMDWSFLDMKIAMTESI